MIGTGTEDYFGASFYYYQQGKFAAPYHGCTVCDYMRGRVAVYRFDVLAPVPFRQSLRVMMEHGFASELACDYTRIAYWYQTKPHQPFPPLPNAVARQPTSPLVNMFQVALMLGIPSLASLGLLWRLRKKC